jgi:hypothetical protein
MCGYCTEAYALFVAKDFRLNNRLDNDRVRLPGVSFFILQEDEELLFCEENVYGSYLWINDPIEVGQAAIILARKNIALLVGRSDFTALANEWIYKSEALVKNPECSNEELLTTLTDYVEKCILTIPPEGYEHYRHGYDVEGHLPVLVKAINVQMSGVEGDVQLKLLTLMVTNFVAELPYFDGIELWLQRLAILKLWKADGMVTILPLIKQNIRPMLLAYIHCKIGLNLEQRDMFLKELNIYNSFFGYEEVDFLNDDFHW